MLRTVFWLWAICMKFLPWKSVKNPTTEVRRCLKYLHNISPSELVSHLQVCRTDGPVITVLLLPYWWASRQLLHVLFSQLGLSPHTPQRKSGYALVTSPVRHSVVTERIGLDITSRINGWLRGHVTGPFPAMSVLGRSMRVVRLRFAYLWTWHVHHRPLLSPCLEDWWKCAVLRVSCAF
jgi:hypothetical protein